MTLLEHLRFLLIFCIVWYGVIILIGLIFESRRIPLIKLQSKGFFPGDIALGAMLMTLWNEYHYYGAFLPHYWIFVAFPVTIALFIVNGIVLKNDHKFYPRRAVYSPTKMWHDITGFLITEIVIVNAALILIIEVIIGRQTFGTISDPIIFIAALIFYALCNVWDATRPATPEMVKARHTEDWIPCWKKAP